MFVLLLCIYIAARQSCKTIQIVLPKLIISISIHIHIYTPIDFWFSSLYLKLAVVLVFKLKACFVTRNRSFWSQNSAEIWSDLVWFVRDFDRLLCVLEFTNLCLHLLLIGLRNRVPLFDLGFLADLGIISIKDLFGCVNCLRFRTRLACGLIDLVPF